MNTIHAGVGITPASAWHIQRVKTKLAMGVYQTEPVACFCGETDAQLVTDRDCYGFAHAMWLCKACGLLYANPRMTESSYAAFYAQEYRQIYDTPDETAETQAQNGRVNAEALQQYLTEQFQTRPSVVFDIGCNAGGWLQPFVEAGAEVHGVDYGPERVATGQTHGLPLLVGSIEALEIMGKQADLIILNHVLEHATNLETMLTRVRGLLRDDGLLYVAVPGLYTWDLKILFQNAHPWQFTAETLTYVMECCGFEEVRANQAITSLWRKAEGVREKTARPSRFIRDIATYLFRQGTRLVPNIRTFNKFNVADRRASVTSALARGLPSITDLIQTQAGRSAVIVGGGPSITGQIDTIRRLQQDGCLVLTIERMAPWCQQQGIQPEYVVTMDASDDVLEAFQEVLPGPTHLVASQCQPAVFDRLQTAPVYLYHTPQKGLTDAELLGPSDHYTVVNGGGSVVLCSLSLAWLMGCSTVHLFGFDCHVTAGTYAPGIVGVGEQKDHLQVQVEDRIFTTTAAYLAFAQQFFQLQEQGRRDGLLNRILVYGDSLVNAMSVRDIRGDDGTVHSFST